MNEESWHQRAARKAEEFRRDLSPQRRTVAAVARRKAALENAAQLTEEAWASWLARYPDGGTGIQKLHAAAGRPELRARDCECGRIEVEDLIQAAPKDHLDYEALVRLAENRLGKDGPLDALGKWIVDSLRRGAPKPPRADPTLSARNVIIARAVEWAQNVFHLSVTRNKSSTVAASACDVVQKAFPTLGLSYSAIERIYYENRPT